MSETSGIGSRTSTKHQSVDALLAFYGECKAKPLIQRLARAKVATAKTFGWQGPPYCPKELASLSGIRCKEVSHDIGGDGRILPYPNGELWIEYRSNAFPERQRFTIFHELAHTLFPDFCEFHPKNHRPNSIFKDPEREFEALCDAGAAEMLLPYEDFAADLASNDRFNWEVIHSLRKRYEASIDATTHRFVDLVASVPCAAAFFNDLRKPAFGHGNLWIQYSKKNSTFKAYLPPGISPPRDSVVTQCYQALIETTLPAKETWWINGNPRTWLVQATKLPAFDDPHYPKVVALFLPSGYLR